MAKQLTIRGVEHNLYTILRAQADQADLSMNRFIIHTLQKAMGLAHTRKKEFDDLDHLAGTWSQEEFEILQTHFQDQRAIDPELWS